jgi:pilus assembly protein Flp/PilA
MKNLYNGIRKFAKDEEGATAVEYGMMVGLIAVAIILTVYTIGNDLNDLFDRISTCIANPTAASCAPAAAAPG